MNTTPLFGYAPIPPFAQAPYIPTARDMAMAQALAQSEEELQKQRQQLTESEKVKEKLKTMENNDNFNSIMEMHTEAERRRFAAMAMQGILSNEESLMVANMNSDGHQYPENIAKYAVACANALIAELDKKKDGNE